MLEEAQLRRKIAEATQKELKERLEREKKFTKWNRTKVQNNWRKIMRLAKIEELRREIEIISQAHERDVDRKDAIIQMLDKDVEEAEEQFSIALRANLRSIDRLVELQDSRLLALEQDFRAQLRVLQEEFDQERKEIQAHHDRDTRGMRAAIAAIEASESEKAADAKTEFDQTREVIRSKNLEAIHVLQSYLDNTIEELERAFETAHLNYLTNSDQRTQDFKNLTQRDQTLAQEIDIKIRKIDRLQSSLSYWKAKLASNTRDCEQRNQTMQEEKDAVMAHYRRLKARMNGKRTTQNKRLKVLTQSARECKKDLARKMDLAEQLLAAAESLRSYSTDDEKIRPFYESITETGRPGQTIEDLHTERNTLRKIEEDVREGMGTKDGADDAQILLESMKTVHMASEPVLAQPAPATATVATTKGEEPAEFEQLDNFYKRYNKVLLDKLALERDRDRLAAENAELESALKQFLEGLTITDDAVDGDNPLMVVNGRAGLTVPVRRMGPAEVTVVDAAAATRHAAMAAK
jgi:DNA repair exonuclease SbcCD ATPase subunit